MDVGRTMELPGEGATLQLPDVRPPEEAQAQPVGAVGLAQASLNLLDGEGPEIAGQVGQELPDHRLLPVVERADGEAGPAEVGLASRAQGASTLMLVERAEDLARLSTLIPPNVVRGARIGRVSVEDGAPEGHPSRRMTVGAKGAVAAREHPLEGRRGPGG